ncbi:hypothetical protein NPIL_299981, partial [Nephila pilipes]
MRNSRKKEKRRYCDLILHKEPRIQVRSHPRSTDAAILPAVGERQGSQRREEGSDVTRVRGAPCARAAAAVIRC